MHINMPRNIYIYIYDYNITYLFIFYYTIWKIMCLYYSILYIRVYIYMCVCAIISASAMKRAPLHSLCALMSRAVRSTTSTVMSSAACCPVSCNQRSYASWGGGTWGRATRKSWRKPVGNDVSFWGYMVPRMTIIHILLGLHGSSHDDYTHSIGNQIISYMK